MLEAIGHEVTRLRRVQIGAWNWATWRPVHWRMVPDAELDRAFPGIRT
ncbi:MAG: hypothetical protein R2712_05710 [Vicinamibacterales bacterium]